MKTVLFTNSPWSISLMLELDKKQYLQGVVLTDTKHEANLNIEVFASSRNIPILRVSKEGLNNELIDWLYELRPELGICLAFPHKFPEEAIQIPDNGILNIHFGALPEYAGADPLFWMLKNQEPTAVLTIHKMTKEFDSGPTIMTEQLSIFPGENHGLLGARLSQLVASSVDKIFQKAETEVAVNGNNGSAIKRRPTTEQLTIDWHNQTAQQIEALVNAANPEYGGAITYFRNAPVRILEVSPADVPNASLLGPGTVVHSSPEEGVFVLCSDYRFLRINIIKTPEAYLTGFKVAALGIKQNDKFNSMINTATEQKVVSI